MLAGLHDCGPLGRCDCMCRHDRMALEQTGRLTFVGKYNGLSRTVTHAERLLRRSGLHVIDVSNCGGSGQIWTPYGASRC